MPNGDLCSPRMSRAQMRNEPDSTNAGTVIAVGEFAVDLVRRWRHDAQVAAAVVEFVAVDVVDMLAGMAPHQEGVQGVSLTAPILPLRKVDVAVRAAVERQAAHRLPVSLVDDRAVAMWKIQQFRACIAHGSRSSFGPASASWRGKRGVRVWLGCGPISSAMRRHVPHVGQRSRYS